MSTIICRNCGCEGPNAQSVCWVCGANIAEVGAAQAFAVVEYAAVPEGDKPTDFVPIPAYKPRLRAKPVKKETSDWERDALVRKYAKGYIDWTEFKRYAKSDGFRLVLETDGKEKRLFANLCKELGIEVVKKWVKK